MVEPEDRARACLVSHRLVDRMRPSSVSVDAEPAGAGDAYLAPEPDAAPDNPATRRKVERGGSTYEMDVAKPKRTVTDPVAALERKLASDEEEAGDIKIRRPRDERRPRTAPSDRRQLPSGACVAGRPGVVGMVEPANCLSVPRQPSPGGLIPVTDRPEIRRPWSHTACGPAWFHWRSRFRMNPSGSGERAGQWRHRQSRSAGSNAVVSRAVADQRGLTALVA